MQQEIIIQEMKMKTKLSLEESRELIIKIKSGKSTKSDEYKLYMEFKSRYRPHIHDNYIYNNDELESEFLLNAWNAIFRADPNVGDPIMFCVRRGNGAMLDYYRKISSQKLILECPMCNTQYTYDRRNKSCKNPHCKCYKNEKIGLISKEKEITDEFITDKYLVHTDNIINSIEIEETLVEVINFLEFIDIDKFEKNLASEALKNKMDLYDYARYTGKSHSWSVYFKNKIISILRPYKDNFLYCL